MAIKKKSWVADCCQIGKVLNVNDDGSLDIAIYNRAGDRLGRTSPVMGGPRSFEPCCAPDHWNEIETPLFPLRELAYMKEVIILKQSDR